MDKKWSDSLGPLILFHRSIDETSDWDRKMASKIKEKYFGTQSISKVNTILPCLERSPGLVSTYKISVIVRLLTVLPQLICPFD